MFLGIILTLKKKNELRAKKSVFSNLKKLWSSAPEPVGNGLWDDTPLNEGMIPAPYLGVIMKDNAWIKTFQME